MRKRLHYWLPLILIILFVVAQPTKAHASTVDSGTYGENITWTLDSSGTMTISGIGDMGEFRAGEWDHWRSVKDSIKAVVINDGVTSIGSYAFSGCANLISVDIPDSVTHIGFWAFYNCTNLSSITIPKNVTSIGSNAFHNCSSLDGFWVDDANPSYSSDQYGVLFNKDKTKLLKAPQTLAGSYAVPDGVTILGSYYELFDHPYDTAFSGCTKLTSITLPDSVTVIDEATFANCSSLSKINIPNGVKEIRYITFMDCTSLTSITIPDSVTYIGNYVFSNCSNLTQITLGKGIQEIYSNAFWGCDNLWHVLYTGTEEEWKNINSDSEGYGDYSGNESLLSATRHYNCTGNEILDLASKKCSICIANCNHNWGNTVITQEATCKEEGVKTYTCTACKETKTEAIAKLSTHTPGADATATKPQTCTVCGKELKPATGIIPPPTTVPPTTVPPTTVPPTTVPPTTVPPTTVPPTTAPPVTEPPVTEPPVTEPPATELPTTEPPTTESSMMESPATEPVTTPTTSETAEPSVAPTQPVGNKKPDNGSYPVVVVVVIVVLAGGGATAGVILWKKKH